jgi:hypothetical protein
MWWNQRVLGEWTPADELAAVLALSVAHAEADGLDRANVGARPHMSGLCDRPVSASAG